jgi:hypothetical protein
VRYKAYSGGSRREMNDRLERERPDSDSAIWLAETSQRGVVETRIGIGEVEVGRQNGIDRDAAAEINIPA